MSTLFSHIQKPLDAALAYAENGWLVFPLETPEPLNMAISGIGPISGLYCSCFKGRNGEECPRTGKHPRYSKELLPDGKKSASTDPDIIKKWWDEWPNANVGICGGITSGLVIVDIDPKNGGDETLVGLLEEHGQFPETLTATTGSGGKHYLFQHPGKDPLSGGANKLGDGVDVKADDGYIVAAPSLHKSGKHYQWDNPGAPIAPLPAWIADILRERAPRKRRQRGEARQYTPVNVEAILGQCAWLRHCRDDAATLPEQEWYHMLSILSRCEHGEEIAKEWSAPFPGYSSAETVSKLEHAREASGPVLCATINHPAYCATCFHRVRETSPVTLGDALPPIIISSRHQREIVADMMTVLKAQQRRPIFQRDNHLVRVVKYGSHPAVIEEHDKVSLTGDISHSADLFVVREKEEKESRVPVAKIPTHFAEQILKAPAHEFPELECVMTMPFFRADGSLVTTPGYDTATKRWYDPSPDMAGLPLKEHPTICDAVAARAHLEQLIQEFPFVGEVNLANMLALILTPFARPLINADVPMALISATAAGTGKGLLCKILSLLVTGSEPEMASLPDNPEEWRKQITMHLVGRDPLVILDNIDRTLNDEHLARLLTTNMWKDRLLGKNDKLALPNLATWVANGNNLEPGRDIIRRVYMIRLDANCEHPSQRTGFTICDILSWTKAHRAEYVADILTIIRAWWCAGRPTWDACPTMGSYERWISMIAGMLYFVGYEDILTNLPILTGESSDTAHDAWGALFYTLYFEQGWHAGTFTAQDLWEFFSDHPNINPPPDLAFSTNKGKAAFLAKVGKVLKQQRDVVFSHGLKLVYVGKDRMSSVKWKVIQIVDIEPMPQVDELAEGIANC